MNGKGPFNFELDTGASPEHVPVDTWVTESLGLSTGAPDVRRVRGAGAAGIQEAFIFPDMHVQWGDRPSTQVGIMSQHITPSRPDRRNGESGLVSETELEGLLGYAVLAGSEVTIDFVTQRLIVR